MFASDVVAFGTVGNLLRGRDELRRRQWEVVWNRTEGFDFKYDLLIVQGDSTRPIVLSEWSSTGLDAKGKTFLREGRATLVLWESPEGLVAVHTHFSFSPASFHDPLLHD